MKNWKKLIASIMVLILVLSMLPTFAMADDAAHTHDDSCYAVSSNLICGLDESEEHQHTDECREQTRTLSCGQEEVKAPAEGGTETPVSAETPAADENSGSTQSDAVGQPEDGKTYIVSFTCDVENAQITVFNNGAPVESIGGNAYILPDGHYTWTAFCEGYQNTEGEFDVAGEAQTITIVMGDYVEQDKNLDERNDLFTMEPVPGATQKDVLVNGERRVVYCMQYDNIWPVPNDPAYHNDPTKYWEASPEEMYLTEYQQGVITRVLYAGYPYDSVGALAPLYAYMGSFADDPASNLTQGLIWSLMAEWGVPGNTHFSPVNPDEIDDPAWAEAYTNLRNYALNGPDLSSLPVGFVPQVNGSTTLVKQGGSWTTGALSITNPDGFKIMYSVTIPDGVTVLDADGNEMYANWEFIDGGWQNTGYNIYGGDTFYLITDDAEAAEGQLITINGSVKIPSDFKQYMTNDVGLADKGDGQGYVQHPFQNMLSVGISSTSFSGNATLHVAGEAVEVHGHKIWDDNNDAANARPESITVVLHANGVPVGNPVTVTEADNWEWHFTNLPKYSDGTEVIYTVTENYVHDYSATYSGYNITNHYSPKTTSINVEKSWVDGSNHDGFRPDHVTVKLYANGEDTGKTLILSDVESWVGAFTDLPEVDTEGQPIEYTVDEVAVTHYEKAITGSAADGFVITNTHIVEHISVSGRKIWVDNDDAAQKRPEKITIELLADGKLKSTTNVAPDADGNWSWNFTELDKYDKGTEIVYSVVEKEVENYTATYDHDSYDITNTFTPGKISIAVVKSWHDEHDQDGIRPVNVTIHLLANLHDTGKTLVLDETNHWESSFTELDEYDRLGNKIHYSITEDHVDGYITGISGNEVNGFIVSNAHKPETVTVSGSKTWDDSNNQDGKRPSSITIHLHADGVPTESKTVTAENGWKWNFIDLPKYSHGEEIVYSVTEDALLDYSTSYSGYNVTNHYTPGKTSLTVEKRWLDDGDRDGKRPANVEIRLLADGVATDKTVTLNADNRWEATFNELDEYKDGKLIVYTVEEVTKVDGYSSIVSGDAETGYVVSNSYTPETINLSGSKTWNDAECSGERRPASITIRLHANGIEKAHKIVTPDEDGNWSWTFTDLPKKENGADIVYTITEDSVDEYSAIYVKDTIDVINNYVPGKVSVSVSKVWDDNSNQDGIRPNSVTIQLYANGQPVSGKTLVLDSENNWTGSFTDLDEYKDGKLVVYTVQEVRPAYDDGYTVAVSGDAHIGFTVTNKHTPEKIKLSGTKVWDDQDDLDRLRPGSIVINIFADGELIESITLRASTNWKWNITGLDKFKDGKEIVYTITEDKVEGYETSITGNAASGFTVTNKHKATLCGILTVTKTVKGTGASYDKEFEFTVTLTDAIGKTINGTYGDMTFVDGVATFKLRHGESASAIGLPAGIKYTVTEARAVGYTKTSAGASGTILGGKTVTAKFVNTRNNGSFGPIPGTGDFNQPITWILLILIAAVIMAVTIFTGKRLRTTGKNNR